MNASSRSPASAAAAAGHEDVLLLERAQRLGRGRGPRSPASARERPLPERAADDRRVLHEAALEGLERVEPRREQRLHGVRQLAGVAVAPPRRGAAPSPRRTAGCRRSARRPLRPARRSPSLPASSDAISSRGLARASSGSRKIEVASRRPPPQLGAALEQLVARQADDAAAGARTHCARCSIRSSMPSSAQWMSSNASTSGAARAERLDAPARTAAKNASRTRCGSSAVGREPRRGASMPEQAADQRGARARRRRPLRLARSRLVDRRRELLPRLPRRVRRRRSRTRRAAPRRAPSRRCPSRRAGSGPSRTVGRRLRSRERALELAQQPRLADAGLADDRDQVRARPRARRARTSDSAARAPRRGRRAALAAAGDARDRAARSSEPDRLPGRDRLGLALQRRAARASLYSIASRVARQVRSPTVTLPGRAAACSRAATFTVSPITV